MCDALSLVGLFCALAAWVLAARGILKTNRALLALHEERRRFAAGCAHKEERYVMNVKLGGEYPACTRSARSSDRPSESDGAK